MEKTFKKVNYSEYEGKYDEQIKEKMANYARQFLTDW